MFEHLFESPMEAMSRHMTEEFRCGKCGVLNYVRNGEMQACCHGQAYRGLNLFTEFWCSLPEIAVTVVSLVIAYVVLDVIDMVRGRK